MRNVCQKCKRATFLAKNAHFGKQYSWKKSCIAKYRIEIKENSLTNMLGKD
jgi:hypothetical protein